MSKSKLDLFLRFLMSHEEINLRYLERYSNISLKNKRSRKKFRKYYARYISKKVYEAYFSYLITKPITRKDNF